MKLLRYVYLIISALLVAIMTPLPSNVYANGLSITLTPGFDRNTEPEGPNPNNPNHYKVFSFTFIITGMEAGEYYDITAKLSTTKYRGTMANYTGQLDEDLKFHRDDYVDSSGNNLLVWNYNSVNSLSKSLDSNYGSNDVPSSVIIRCYDYGPTGKLSIKIKKKGLFGASVTAEHSVPFDENGNGILDGWEDDDKHTHTNFWGSTKDGYNPKVDNETTTGNNNDGDGWSIIDEYRGLWGKGSHIRLDPDVKDVIYGTGASVAKYGTGYYNIPHHTLHDIDLTYVLHPFANISNSSMTAPLPNNEISEDIGWVNFNSHTLPGFKRVWAIRVTSMNEHPLQSNPLWADTAGMTARGSPNKRSLIYLFPGKIEESVKAVFELRKANNSTFNYDNTQLAAGVHTVILATLSHEIGHTLNLGHRDYDTSCVMYPYANYKPNPSLPPGLQVILNAIGFSSTHDPDWAATGQEGDQYYKLTLPDASTVIWLGETVPPGTPDPPTDPPDTLPTLPSAPTNVKTTHSDTNIALSWSAPDTSGTNPITNYEYSYRVADIGTWSDWEATDNGSVTSVYISDLTNGTLYEFIVRAKTIDGYSVSSTSVRSAASTIPDVPTGLTAIGYDGYVYLYWSTPYNGGASITDYEYVYGQSGGSFNDWSSFGSISNYGYVYSLTNGTEYKFKIRAKNINGVSSESSTVYATPQGTPSAPTNFTVTAGDGEVTLSWGYPLYTNGATITGFEYGYREGSGGYFSSWTSLGQSYSTTITGLTNGTYYEFRLRATSINGSGERAGPIGTTPKAAVTTTAPSAPGWIDTYDVGYGNVLLVWSEPDDDGGSDITDYEYAYRESGGTWSDWSSPGTFPSRYVYFYSLTVGITYEFKARAVNSIGSSDESPTTTLTISAYPPNAPTGLSGTYYSTGHIYLSWTAPTSDGGAAIIGYEFRYAFDGVSFSDWISTGGWGINTSVRLQNVSAGYNYTFQVRAVNSAGGGSASSSITVSTD